MSDDTQWLKFAGYALIVCVLIAVFLYLKPRFISRSTEGFSTIALGSDYPKCFTRNPDAQELLLELKTATKGMPPSSDRAMALDEFSLILQKLLCMDADITSMGAGTYATYGMPFNTHHDMEPVGNFVGRCLRNAVKSRDIELTIGKLHSRGNELIGLMMPSETAKAKAFSTFNSIVTQTIQQITPVCVARHNSMDIPSGVRDPGYFTPPTLQQYSTYQVTGTTTSL